MGKSVHGPPQYAGKVSRRYADFVTEYFSIYEPICYLDDLGAEDFSEWHLTIRLKSFLIIRNKTIIGPDNPRF